MKFEIIGKPIGKGRPRLGKYGTYTPTKTANYETLVKWTFANEFKNFKPIEGAVKAKITAVFTVPKSYSKKKRAEALTRIDYTHKPDCDNIAKIILDSLNGLAYIDDSQVSCLLVFKNYGEQEKVIVELEKIGG
jgi:Holliday junction resolvase RusA-like endonuclease